MYGASWCGAEVRYNPIKQHAKKGTYYTATLQTTLPDWLGLENVIVFNCHPFRCYNYMSRPFLLVMTDYF